MKKLLFLMFTMTAIMMSCTKGQTTTNTNDGDTIDTAVVDTVDSIDSVVCPM